MKRYYPDISEDSDSYETADYAEYQQIHSEANRPEGKITLTAENVSGTAEIYSDFNGRNGEAVYTDENSSVDFEF